MIRVFVALMHWVKRGSENYIFNYAVKKALDKVGIEIPYPYQVSIIKRPDEASDEDLAAGS